MSGRKRDQASNGGGGLPHGVVWGGVLLVGVVVGLMAFHLLSPAEDPAQGGLLEVDAITYEHSGNHLHGIGFDEGNNRLFIATHYGLFMMGNATGAADSLFQVGGFRDDMMGFSLDPHDGDRMFASGHPFRPALGEPRNIGVVRSTDGGFTWEQVWDGPGGRHADFHSMALSSVDPVRLVGAFQGQLHVTLDDGATWGSMDSVAAMADCWGAPCLSWDAEEADRLWLANRDALYTRADPEDEWQTVREGHHGAVLAHPADNRLWLWSPGEGVQMSQDGGESWDLRGEDLLEAGADVFAFSGGPGDADVAFAAVFDGRQVLRTLDGGMSWQRVLPLD